MLLDLTHYRRPVEHFARTFQPGELGETDDAYQVVAPAELDMDVHKDGSGEGARFRFVGTVKTTLELPCSRCLEPYRLPVDAALDLRLQPAAATVQAGEQEVNEDDLETSYYRDDQIDLNELLREQFYLALPMKPLCRETCQGLCAMCGANKNVTVCACSLEWEDPRLAPLKGLAVDHEHASKPGKSRPS
jgi:uncharacterized protein